MGYAATGKSALLGVARGAWEEAGWQVRSVALSGLAAENLGGHQPIAKFVSDWCDKRTLWVRRVIGTMRRTWRSSAIGRRRD
jgi:hypothetical protein